MVTRILWCLLLIWSLANGLNISDCSEPKDDVFCFGTAEGNGECQKSLAGVGCFAANNCQAVIIGEVNRSTLYVNWKLYVKLADGGSDGNSDYDEPQSSTSNEAGFFLNSSLIEFDASNLPIQTHIPKVSATQACSIFVYANGTQRCTTVDHSDDDDINTPYIYQNLTKEDEFMVGQFLSESSIVQYPISGKRYFLDLLSQEVYIHLYSNLITSNDYGRKSTCTADDGPFLLFPGPVTEPPSTNTTTTSTTKTIANRPDRDPRVTVTSTVESPSLRPSKTGASGLGIGTIILISLGVLVLIGIIVTIVLFAVSNKRRRTNSSDASS